MINKLNELKSILKCEKKLYYKEKSIGRIIFDKFNRESNMEIWKYQKKLRITEYLFNGRKNVIKLILYMLYLRKTNKLGLKLGIYIPINVFDKGLKIDHYGSITINGLCKIGKNCRLHGNNCIGNKGVGREDKFPIIGDNLDLGVGAVIIGNVNIGNNVIVGANAVVNKSWGNNCILVGLPAKDINKKK